MPPPPPETAPPRALLAAQAGSCFTPSTPMASGRTSPSVRVLRVLWRTPRRRTRQDRPDAGRDGRGRRRTRSVPPSASKAAEPMPAVTSPAVTAATATASLQHAPALLRRKARRPAQPLALRLGPAQPRLGALDQQVALELRHRVDDAHRQLAGRARQVDAAQRQAGAPPAD